jgi:acyl-CoA thioester hydrolase
MADTPGKLVHTTSIPIRWGDMDAYCHVNNTVYFRYMEQVRVEYLESLGYAIVPIGTSPVIINSSCTFLVPLAYPGVVEVSMFLGAPGRSSIPSSYEMRLRGGDTVYAVGAAKIVWIDMASGKSVAIPEALRARLTDIGA